MKKASNIKALIGFAVLILLVLSVVYFFSKNTLSNTAGVPTGTGPDNTVQPNKESIASERIMIGVPSPLAPSDLAYILDEASGDLQAVDQPAGWRVSNIQKTREAAFEPIFNDEGATRFLLGSDWNVVLRDTQAVPYKNASFIGLLNENIAVLQADKDVRYILFAHKDGKIDEVYELPELYIIQGIYGNSVWITTALMGEGLESEPQGPSHVIRIDAEAYESMITEDQVIERLTAYDAKSYAYRFGDGTYKARHGNYVWEGGGTPLLWLDKNTLLVSQGKTLKRVNVTESSQDTLGELEKPATVAGRVQFVSP